MTTNFVAKRYRSEVIIFYPLLTDQRGVKCHGCTEKADFVKKCEETEHMDL